MPKFTFSLLACLLLATACHHHPKPCPAPQPRCPEAAPARCTPQPRPTYSRKVGSNRHAVSLRNLQDYLPGIPPGYTSI